MERSVLGVPEHVRVMFRVFLLRDGVWELVQMLPPFDKQQDAFNAAQPLSSGFENAVYGVRRVKVLLH